MKRHLGLTLAVLLAGSALSTSAMAVESTDPIKVITNNWTSQLVLSNVVGQLLQQMGYNVEYKSSDTQLQFTALASGDMDFQVEVWEGSMAESFDKAVADTALRDWILKEAQADQERWKIDSTPSFVVNGQKYAGDMGFEAFLKLIPG